ncbi:MAG: ATP-binding protein [Acidilobus sp.]
MTLLLDGSAVKVYDQPRGKCIRCGGPARVRIEYARAWLCDEHFLDYVRQKVLRSVQRYDMLRPGDKVLVGVSGGKDSSALMDILDKVSEQLKIDVIAVHINMGIGEYSRESLEAFRQACSRARRVRCLELDLKELVGLYLPDILRRIRRPACSVCGLIRRYLLNALALELGATAVATGHNMNDLMTYAVKNFLGQRLDQIAKLGPVEEGEASAVRRVRPLYDVYEDETRAYVMIGGVPYTPAVCPFKPSESVETTIKEMLESLERASPSFLISSARALSRELGRYPRPEEPIRRCKYCGMPTSRDVCGFCTLTQSVLGRPMGPEVRERVRSLLNRQTVS